MSIVITRPEIEALIKQRLETGAFQSPEDVILDALRSSESVSSTPHPCPLQVLRRRPALLFNGRRATATHLCFPMTLLAAPASNSDRW
ncbi:MAG: hypothetical protein WDO18_20400 [Acidobacteriota bacterium]